MTSTFLSYRVYSANIAQSLQRVAAEPQNANDQKYFEANIGKVTSVDGFLNNYRLFTYAMKAYGLQDLGNAKALMKQVLESDLSDPNSVANRLNDNRYKSFAQAFNFTTQGSVASSGQVQTSSQQQDLLTRMNLDDSATAGVESSLASVTSVDSLEANDGLYTRALSAYGLDPTKVTKSQVALALESDLSNPTSFANRSDIGTSTTYASLRAMAEDFNFAADGTIGSQSLLQAPQNIAATQTAYMSQIPSDAAAQSKAKDESAYYAKMLPELTSVDQLVSNTRLFNYVQTAFGLDKNMSTTQLRGVLTSNLLDPKSVANTFNVDPKNPPTTPSPYQLLASAFTIGPDGMAWDHGSVISAANVTATTTAYKAATTATAAATFLSSDTTSIAAAATAAQTETDYFTSQVSTMHSVAALLSDSRLVAYLRTAFDVPAPKTTDANTTTTADLASILESNLLDPTSAANTMGANARKLAAAFNFAPNGLVYSQRQIETPSNITATTAAYANLAGTSAGAKAAAQTETDYFTSTLPRLKSVDDLLGNKRLVAYITKAYSLPSTTSTATLRQVLTSDLLDPKSAANRLGGGYQTLAAAFNVSSDGSITHAPDQQVQTKTGIAATHVAFLNQSMETEAGQTNDGVRLALYFKRLAPTITNPFQILADKALTVVFQTMLGLSANSSKADIDTQARTLTSKLKFADLQDPAKVDKLVSRFAALYDLTNSSSSSSSSVTSLFG